MVDRQSSDEVAAIAARLMRTYPHPVTDKMAFEISAALDSGASIREALEPLMKDVRRLAASVVSQADGPE